VHLIFPCCPQLLTKAGKGGCRSPSSLLEWDASGGAGLGFPLKLYIVLRVDQFFPAMGDQMI